MRNTWWDSGKWNVLCDRCGFKFKNTDLKLEWDGLYVCGGCWETRHPQELIRPLPDTPALPWTRPEAPDNFVGPDYNDAYETAECTTFGSSSIPDYAIPDCAIPDKLIPGLI